MWAADDYRSLVGVHIAAASVWLTSRIRVRELQVGQPVTFN